jgi:hypothetical protein
VDVGRRLRSARVVLRHLLSGRSLAVIVIIAMVCGVLLLLARGAERYGENLALNVAAEFIGALLVVFALTPMLRRAQQGGVREHRRLDYGWFTDRVATAGDSVRVLHTFSRLFAPPYSDRFLAATRALLRRGGFAHILLMHPDSLAAAQRTAELRGHGDVGAETRRNLVTLDEFRRSLPADARARCEVRLSTASASVQMYQWDGRLLASFLPVGRLSGDHTQLEVAVDSPLGDFLLERFEELWPDGVTIEDYMRLRVVLRDGTGETAFPVRYVRADDDLYLVAEADLIAHLARARHHDVTAVVGTDPVGTGPIGTGEHAVDIVAPDSPEAATVRRLVEAKYGRAERIFVRLVPRI